MNVSQSTLRQVGVGLSAVVLAVIAAFALDSASLQASTAGGRFGGGRVPGIQGAPGQVGQPALAPTNGTTGTTATNTNRTTR